MISDMVRFDIVRCDNETQKKDGKQPCKTPEEIDEYVDDFQVDVW